MTAEPLLQIDGDVAHPMTFTFAQLAAFAEDDQIADMRSLDPKRQGQALRLAALLRSVGPHPEANWLTLHASRDDFHASIPLRVVQDRAVLIYALEGQSLPGTAGGPVRFYIPNYTQCGSTEIDECANVKYVDRIEISKTRGQDNRPEDERQHALLHRQAGSEAT